MFPTATGRAAYDRAWRMARHLPKEAVLRVGGRVLIRRPVIERFLAGELPAASRRRGRG